MEEEDKARKFFHQTLEKLREQKERENDCEQERKDKMTSAYASLNENIKSNREILVAIQDVKAYEKVQKDAERDGQRREMLLAKQDPDEFFLKEERVGKYQRGKKTFEKKIVEGKEKILGKIIQEEQNRIKQEKKKANSHWMDKYDSQHPHYFKNPSRKLPRMKRHNRPQSGGSVKRLPRESVALISGEEVGVGDDSSEGEVDNKIDSPSSGEEILPEPEYRGLWETGVEPKKQQHKLISDESMQKAMEKLKTNIIKKQVAAGREFKGQPFRSQPEVILFKDFDVDRSYHKRVQLTNVSYTVNYCRFVEVTNSLKDFCFVEFDPPGPLSAGLTCWFQMKFTPRVDMDVEGAVCFLTQTGPFEVPVSCCKKKCIISLENERIDLGRICKGEKIRKSIELRNQGAIPTDFTIGEKPVQSAEMQSHPAEETREQPPEVPEEPTAEPPLEIMKTEPVTDCSIKCVTADGHLAGYSKCLVEFEFAPDEAGVEVKDFAINFSHKGQDTVVCTVCAESTDLPIWLERDAMDMRICIVGSFYQDSVVLHNQGISPMAISTDLPNAMNSIIHVLPLDALVQGQGKLSLLVQFTPTLELWNDNYREYFNTENGDFNIHFNFIIKGQTLPLPFTLTAILTRAEISLDKTHINFGTCHMQESIIANVELTNHSLLPQKIGFISVPHYISIRPDDGFITLLPNEKCEMRLAFNPEKIKLYEFSLTCKSQYDRDYNISCTGRGVQSGLQLSHTKIAFRSTIIDDFSFANIHISNPKIARLSSAKIRGVAPVNSDRIFQFDIPKDAPIKISPQAGILATGEKASICVEFSPTIPSQETAELARESLKEEVRSVEGGTTSRVSLIEKKSSCAMLAKGSKPPLEIPKEKIKEDSPAWLEAKDKLTQMFQDRLDTFHIPCFVSLATQSPTILRDETLLLEVALPTNKPKLKLNGVQGRCVEFGECLIGMKITRKLELENTSEEEIVFSVEPFNINGPFEVMNAPRPIAPGKTFNVVVNFVPDTDEHCYEQCTIRYDEYNRVSFFLNAKGVKLELELLNSEGNAVEGALEMGDVVLNETLECNFAINNKSSLPCDYCCSMDETTTGKNYTGLPAFNITPFRGEIPANSKKDITVSLTPDRPSLLYAEVIRIKINKEQNYFSLNVKGRGHDLNMYVHNDTLYPEDLMLPLSPTRYTYVTKVFVNKATADESNLNQVLKITNIKHRSTGFKPNGDFAIELLEPPGAQKVFHLEPMKSAVEAGTTMDVKLTFDPKQLETGHRRMLAYYKVTVKGDSVKQYNLLLRGVDTTV